MNKDLKHRIFDIPQDILDKINHTVVGLNGKNTHGIQRAKTLLLDKKVKYGQLKRIIHDIQNMDKVNERMKYDLCGGDLMEKWAKQFLDNERDFISNKKDSRKNANEMSGLSGERKNGHIRTHNKDFNFRIPTNLIKSKGKSTISPITSIGLFEEINAHEAFDLKGTISTILNGKRNIAIWSKGDLTNEIITKLHSDGIKMLPVPKHGKITKDSNVIMYKSPSKAGDLYNYMINHKGFISDSTPEEAWSIGKMLEYTDNSVMDYIKRKYSEHKNWVPLNEEIKKIKKLITY